MSGSQLIILLYIFAFFGIYYVLLIRPQQKRAKERRALIDSLRVNDEVITAGGLYGKVKDVRESIVILQIDDNVRVKVEKEAIADRQVK